MKKSNVVLILGGILLLGLALFSDIEVMGRVQHGITLPQCFFAMGVVFLLLGIFGGRKG